MKNRKTFLAVILTLVLAISIVTVSAAAASAGGKQADKPATKPDGAICEASGDCAAEESYEESIKGMSELTEKEKEALLADLAEIEALEARIDALYDRLTDKNADKLYDEIDALYEKLDTVLDRNAELWDRIDAEYDKRIAANEPDIPFEFEEDDLAICGNSR